MTLMLICKWLLVMSGASTSFRAGHYRVYLEHAEIALVILYLASAR